MAGDSKIWIMAFFLLASYVYKAIKKKNKQAESAGESTPSDDESLSTSWGLDGLIKEFEASYGVSNADQNPVSGNNEAQVNQEVQNYQEVEVDPVIQPKELPKGPKSASDSAYSINENEEKDSYSHQNISSDSNVGCDIDLREMVISKVILDRPEY